MLLEAANPERIAQLGLEGLDRCLELSDGGDDGMVGTGDGHTGGVTVGVNPLTFRGADHHANCSELDEPNDRLLTVVANAPTSLVHRQGVDPVTAQYLRGPGRN